MKASLKLYTYFRSTAAYRVRLALTLKGLDYDAVPVHLLKKGGEHKQSEYLEKNPGGLVPALETDDAVLAQSLSIIEYLDETWPEPTLLPRSPLQRAQVRAFAQSIACDIHPLNNLRVLQYLKRNLGADEDAVQTWYEHWIAQGFRGVEEILARQQHGGDFCFGDSPGLADICLIPQVYNAVRFNCPLDDYPNIRRIDRHCRSLPAFAAAAPDRQADAV